MMYDSLEILKLKIDLSVHQYDNFIFDKFNTLIVKLNSKYGLNKYNDTEIKTCVKGYKFKHIYLCIYRPDIDKYFAHLNPVIYTNNYVYCFTEIDVSVPIVSVEKYKNVYFMNSIDARRVSYNYIKDKTTLNCLMNKLETILRKNCYDL